MKRLAVAGVLAGGLCLGAVGMAAVVRSGAPSASGAGAITASRGSAIVSAAQRVSPAVVSVSVVTTQVVRRDPFGG